MDGVEIWSNVHCVLFLQKYGTVKKVVIIKDRQTSESKGLAYVTFTKASDAALAYESCGPGMATYCLCSHHWQHLYHKYHCTLSTIDINVHVKIVVE